MNDSISLKLAFTEQFNNTIVIKSKNPNYNLIIKFEIVNIQDRNFIEECLDKILNGNGLFWYIYIIIKKLFKI